MAIKTSCGIFLGVRDSYSTDDIIGCDIGVEFAIPC